ncbi:glycosyltransferase [Bacteroides congonensis]
MNILFYTEQTLTPMTGGIGRITSVLTDYFRNVFGYRVYSIYSKEVNPAFPVTETDGKICLRLHDRLGIRLNLWGNYKKAAKYIEEHQIDVVIVQTSLDVVGKLRKALDGVNCNPVIISVLHFTPGTDECFTEIRDIKGVRKIDVAFIKLMLKVIIFPLYKCMIGYATKKAYRNAYVLGDKVVLLSAPYKNVYKKYAGICDSSKFYVQPNCLSFNEEYRKEDLCRKEKIVLVVARLNERIKRISVMLKVWKEIEQMPQYEDWKFIIVGDGESKTYYQHMIGELALKRCFMEGSRQPMDYYCRASIFLMTSLFEGFPMTLVEAQQFGCVPIVYDAFESLKDVVINGRNGMIVPNDKEDHFVESLTALMADDDSRGKMAVNALGDCRKFSQENVCKQWKIFLEEICQRKEKR